ncbi:MAG: hypothetical protein ABL958_07305 [Bdellovibrionia bacterium]
MKIAAFILTFVLSFAAQAQRFMAEQGSYEGRGKFRTEDGESGTYSISVQFAERMIRGQKFLAMSSKSNGGGRTASWEIFFSEDRNGFFKVVDADLKQIGDGFCLEFQCHFSVSGFLTHTQETLSFQGPVMYVLGMRSQAGKKSSWQEILQKQ